MTEENKKEYCPNPKCSFLTPTEIEKTPFGSVIIKKGTCALPRCWYMQDGAEREDGVNRDE